MKNLFALMLVVAALVIGGCAKEKETMSAPKTETETETDMPADDMPADDATK